MPARSARRRPFPPALPAVFLCALAAPGCEKKKDERHARADLEKARARITAAMDRIAAEEAAARVVVVVQAVGDRPDDVARALADARGLSIEDARLFLASTAGAYVAMSQPMGRDEAEPLRDALARAGATVAIEPATTAGASPPPKPDTTPSPEPQS
jgi:ribosomal protein L7/L12